MIRNSVFLIGLIIIIIIPVILVSLFVIALLSFHLYLIIVGKTTKETIRGTTAKIQESSEIKISEVEELKHTLVQEFTVEQEEREDGMPFLYFGMTLTKEEAEYLSNYSVCLNDNIQLV